MRAFHQLLACAILGVASSAATAGASVTWIDADHFADVPFSPIERERLLKEFDEHFARLGQLLPAGQELKIEVTELDLAGRLERTRHTGQEIRVLTGGADWPRMHLRYTLSQEGKVLSSGSSELSSMNYLREMSLYSSSASLRHEKKMIDDWFSKTFHVQVKHHL